MAQSATAQSPTPSNEGAAIVVPPSDKTARQTEKLPSDAAARSGSSQETSIPAPDTPGGKVVVSPPVTQDGKPAGTPETGKP
jgi:hypothetical protein